MVLLNSNSENWQVDQLFDQEPRFPQVTDGMKPGSLHEIGHCGRTLHLGMQ